MDRSIPVVIFCGGLGTRLREETEFRPKPMVKIGNRPILWHIMKIYAHYGYKKFILCLGYKGELIKEYFYHYEIMNSDATITLGANSGFKIHNSHEENNWQITLCNTGDEALKGARLKRIEKYVNADHLMVTYGDGVANIDIGKLFDFHKSHGRIATLIGVRPLSRFGELFVENNIAKDFVEKPQTSKGGLINGGFFVFDRKIFHLLKDSDDCDLEYGVLGKLVKDGELMVYQHDGFWQCMDNIRDAEYLNQLWTDDKAHWKVW